MAAQDERLKRLVSALFTVHQHDDIDCETCSQQLECLAEMVNNGVNARELLPAVEAHLHCCADCTEEFEALLAILRAEASGELSGEPSQRPANDR